MPIIDNRASSPSCAGFRSQLLRAELAGELSEFHALSVQAVLALAEGSEFANDYLEMAEAVAESPHEYAIVAGICATRDRVQSMVVAEHSQGTGDQVAELWRSLLIALSSLGDATTPNATHQVVSR